MSFRQFCSNSGFSEKLANAFINVTYLYVHQVNAIESILEQKATIVSTGTGSGKTETFLIPIVDHCLKKPDGGVKAVIIYPMNALANDQVRRIKGIAEATGISVGLFTGDTTEDERNRLRAYPPDILITNYVMLDWMLNRAKDRTIFEQSLDSLRFVVLDEIHTYRGSKATHLKYLLARLRARLLTAPIPIGTSATLTKKTNENGQQNGTEIDSETRQFVTQLLEVDDFTLIRPVFEPELVAESDPIPLFRPPNNQLDWQLEADVDLARKYIGALTGKIYSPSSMLADRFSDTPIYQDLRNHLFVRIMRQAMIDSGAQRFSDLVRLFYSLPGSEAIPDGEAIVKSFLSALSFVNYQCFDKELPLFDFRIHLFISDIGGHLKRCLKCHRFHSGRQEFCSDCGFPLFYVYGEDPRYLVGKISHRRLRWDLRRRSNDQPNSYFVLINLSDRENTQRSMGDSGIVFDGDIDPENGEITLIHQPEGGYHLLPLPATTFEKLKSQLISLADATPSNQYLATLVSSWLDFQPPRKKKLLAFVDSRALASKYASGLRDWLASRFLRAFMHLHYPQREAGVSINDLWRRLQLATSSKQDQTPLESQLLSELGSWYWRAIGQVPDDGQSGEVALALTDFENYAPLEQELLRIFLHERAIDKPSSVSEADDNDYIRFRLYLVDERKGVHCEAGGASEAPGYSSISLTKHAQKYRSFITSYGPEVIQTTLDFLTKQQVLVRRQTPDQKWHYYLNGDHVLVIPPLSQPDEYFTIRRQLMLTCHAHSSESKNKRPKLEEGFKAGEIHCLIATPTLEMGIDIGELNGVLMLGVPPSPANYMQRAGRAGRRSDSGAATVVTFCREDNPHDQIYYMNPKELIDGVISPPNFDPENLRIMTSHVNAFLLSDCLSSEVAVNSFLEEYQSNTPAIQEKVFGIFGKPTGLAQYLEKDFLCSTQDAIGASFKGNLLKYLYDRGFFPDYGFRRDAVYVVPAQLSSKDDDSDKSDSPGYHKWHDLAVGERDPERAYLDLVPGRTIYMADDIYLLMESQAYQSFQISKVTEAGVKYIDVRSYPYFLGQEERRYAQEEETVDIYNSARLFHTEAIFSDRNRIMATAHDPVCKLWFVNYGLRSTGESPGLGAGNAPYNLGYELERDALILRFEKAVCGDDEIPLSFSSAFYSALIDRYGLDSSEVGVLISPDLTTSLDQGKFFVIFFDRTGNGALPFSRIQNDEFDQMVEATFHRVENCTRGKADSGCDAGCYHCCKNQAFGYWSASVHRSAARMVAGYLLGKTKFVPVLSELDGLTDTFDLTLTLSDSGGKFFVKSETSGYQAEKGEGYNRTIFALLLRAIHAEWTPGMESLCIQTNLHHVRNAINGENRIKKDDAEYFARLQFELLRFKRVFAEQE